MKITTAWCDDGDPGEQPSMVAAYDEISFDSWGRVPDYYEQAKATAVGEIREVVFDLGDFDPRSLFTAPEVRVAPCVIPPIPPARDA